MLVLQRMTHTDPPEYIPCSWVTGTDAEIEDALEKHYQGRVNLYEYWNLGEERVVNLSAIQGQTWETTTSNFPAQEVTFVLSEKGGKTLEDGNECIFQVDLKDNLLNTQATTSLTEGCGVINTTRTSNGGWRDSDIRTWCNDTFKTALPPKFLKCFKKFKNQSGKGYSETSGLYETLDLFALRSIQEITGTVVRPGTNYNSAEPGEGSQIWYYKTTSNRIHHVYDPTYSEGYRIRNIEWWTRSAYKQNNAFVDGFFCLMGTDGSWNFSTANYGVGISPFGVI